MDCIVSANIYFFVREHFFLFVPAVSPVLFQLISSFFPFFDRGSRTNLIIDTCCTSMSSRREYDMPLRYHYLRHGVHVACCKTRVQYFEVAATLLGSISIHYMCCSGWMNRLETEQKIRKNLELRQHGNNKTGRQQRRSRPVWRA